MKLHDDDIAAAGIVFDEYGHKIHPAAISAALFAAYTVRKARKAKKRERQRKEKDAQVQGSAKDDGMLP